MEVSEQLRDLIQKKRRAKNWTLSKLADVTGLSIATLSAIETGALKGIKDETFHILAKNLELEPHSYISSDTLRIAFGPCCWASAVINSVVKDTKSSDEPLDIPNLQFFCYADEQKQPVSLQYYNQLLQRGQRVLTANETLGLLMEDEVDIAFLPALTTKNERGIERIARTMNTVKGGLYLFIIVRSDDRDHPFRPEADSDSISPEEFGKIRTALTSCKKEDEGLCCFTFPKGSIASEEVQNKLFMGTEYYEKYQLEMMEVVNFEKEIEDRVHDFFAGHPKAKYFVYAGWDYHIDKLKKKFSKSHIVKGNSYYGKEFDSYRFTQCDVPFTQMSYDIVTTTEKYDQLHDHEGMIKLLSLLGTNVNQLNALKSSAGNIQYRLIGKFLDMDREFNSRVLNSINWEFLLYPEWFDKRLK